MSDPDNSATNREAPPSDRKSILELRKLELEIAHLTRPFWQSTTFLSLVIAFAGLFVGFYTGFFDKQKVLLDITKANLERDVKNLDGEKLRVTGDIARLKATFLQELTVTTEREVEIFLLLEAHALECTYDRAKAAVVFADLKTLREQHRKHFVEQYVRTFPPLQARFAQLRAQCGENKGTAASTRQ